MPISNLIISGNLIAIFFPLFIFYTLKFFDLIRDLNSPLHHLPLLRLKNIQNNSKVLKSQRLFFLFLLTRIGKVWGFGTFITFLMKYFNMILLSSHSVKRATRSDERDFVHISSAQWWLPLVYKILLLWPNPWYMCDKTNVCSSQWEPELKRRITLTFLFMQIAQRLSSSYL